MKITTERLKELADLFGVLLISRDTDMFAEAEAALRELISLREAEPVVYRSRHSSCEPWIIHGGEKNLWENQQLIIHPNHRD